MKKFEFLTKANKWQAIVDKGYADKKKSGVPCRIIHENGSWKVIANAENVPEGTETRFKAEPRVVTYQEAEETVTLMKAIENLATTGQTILPA
jgi:hypothetical protein|tara:strand:- start:216 stop:494 length:279 start_codon:yes stop_codon:yes gene_type:complete